MVLAVIFINIICVILFYKIGYNLLDDKIKKIILNKFGPFIDFKNTNIPPKRKGKKKRSSKIMNTQNENLVIVNNSQNKDEDTNNKNKKDEVKDEVKDEEEEEDIDDKLMKDLNDYELNSLSYNDAIKYDNRTYWEYYLSLIKTKQLIVFTFYTYSDYNSRIIKISLFFFSFALFYIINALFFNDSTMHQIYEDQGVFNFLFQIPQILYSTIISIIIKTILSMLSLSEKNIIEIKNQKTLELANEKMKEKKKRLLIKFILFFVISFLLLILFWYYISCFCAVYKNTQIYLIKDTSISFATSLIYPFVINLIPGLLRIYCIKEKNKSCLYRISKIIQLI